MAAFQHPNYQLVDGDRVERLPTADERVTASESEEVMTELARFVECKIMTDFHFEAIPIPEDSDPYTTILASPGWVDAAKILVIVQNAYASQLGIFSRSICFDQGLKKGTWLPYIERALNSGYAVIILRPNTNSIILEGEEPVKLPIIGSESPEIHVLNFWTNIIPRAERASHIAFLSYGNGASLCKDLYLREFVTSQEQCGNGIELNRIKAFVTIEASHILERDDPSDIREELGRITVNMESNSAQMGYRLAYRKESLGTLCISLGLPPGETEVKNVAESVHRATSSVFKYLTIAEAGGNVAKNFASLMARENGLDASTAVVMVNPSVDVNEPTGTQAVALSVPTSSPAPEKPGLLARLFGWNKANGKVEDDKLTVNDFDLLKIVGKGAFGKVMLVRKKNNLDEGKVYAMKVLRKEMIAAQGQVENTKSERDILFEVRHPYIVRLRYAFQSHDKLYLVTDYYNGGTLYYHLRKSRQFTEERACFYAAELLLALEHLHKQNIIYRDLKLENVLMDHQGHLALTDFGLSKQNIDVTGGATTFCGTAEYIAPELLKGHKYGSAIDWWSFGILIYEMLHGRTPFFDKNRKLMFYRVINAEPTFPPTFSPAACNCIRGLLRVNEAERLGSGPRGAQDIKDTDFFKVVDFDKLFRRELPPPFIPDVKNEFDTTYVPKTFLKAGTKDSTDGKKKKSKAKNPVFEEFTFAGDRHLDG